MTALIIYVLLSFGAPLTSINDSDSSSKDDKVESLYAKSIVEDDIEGG